MSIEFDFERVPRRKNKVGKLAIFQLLEAILKKLARAFFKDRLCGLGRRLVKQHDHRHISFERLQGAGKLLSKHPLADVGVVSGKAELDQLTGSPFHVL